MRLLTLLSALVACSEPPPPPPPGVLDFVRGGVVTPAVGHTGQALGDGRRLVRQPWQPGAPTDLDGLHALAPPEIPCLTLHDGAVRGDPVGLRFGPDALEVALRRADETGALRLDPWTGDVVGAADPLPPAPEALTATPAQTAGLQQEGATLTDPAAGWSWTLPAPDAPWAATSSLLAVVEADGLVLYARGPGGPVDPARCGGGALPAGTRLALTDDGRASTAEPAPGARARVRLYR